MVKLAAKLNNLLILYRPFTGVSFFVILIMSNWHPQLLTTSKWHSLQDLFQNTNVAQKGYKKLMNEREGIMYGAPEEDSVDIDWISGFVMGFPQNVGQKSIHENGN